MSELSDAEQSCLAGNVAPQQVMALLGGAPDLVPPEETAALIQCLEDETLLRLFLTGLIGQTGPLSAETSTCVRSGFANFDLRSVMLATPAESNEAAAMAGSLAGFLLTLSCLSEEEWQAVGPTLGMGLTTGTACSACWLSWGPRRTGVGAAARRRPSHGLLRGIGGVRSTDDARGVGDRRPCVTGRMRTATASTPARRRWSRSP